ncbi:MAG: hypothetical protein II847_09070 [Ruminobacter sp.]|uniref:Uncharacterized protein n=1 Tax=Ruminobacter amylophilus TaxID=867 RepID=A0A662ZH61_9GAMM|nr:MULTISPECIES: DUF5718 family protein [Ruminobacter]MBQ3776258.1 hypothetical protein [Ruminobacter sp.]SFP17446.1 hypothetical protein SAMN02910344_00631 [Ruminobacter amylophilus]
MNLEKVIGLGVAGNFTGHLEQAGEASDFRNVAVKDVKAPKAIFPFYLPACAESRLDTFLHTYPISSDRVDISGTIAENHQIEPEVGILCDIEYEGDQVKSLRPVAFGAYNDCSIRRPGARKISEKKNWGAASKGFSSNVIALDSFTADGVISSYRIACFLKRDGVVNVYGVNSAARDYSYMYDTLLNWIVDKMNNQKDEGPAENIHEYLLDCGKPQQALISIGATRYTEYGETHFLKPGDTSYVVVYHESYSEAEILKMVETDSFAEENISVLAQKAV